MYVGKKVTRVDAYDKVIGRTKYTDDLCDKSAYIARILHSTIANGRVLSIDTSEAEKIPGVVKVFTCFDLKEKHYFPTAGHHGPQMNHIRMLPIVLYLQTASDFMGMISLRL